MSDLKAQLIAKTRELGFADCRIAPAKPAARREIFEQWVAEGKYGEIGRAHV
jgi:epoxyqueuosine reductase